MTRGAALLLLIGTAGGCALGWLSTAPVYRAVGVVSVPSARAPSLAFPPCPWRKDPASALASDLARSRRLTLRALEQDAWRATGEAVHAGSARAFEARRDAVPLRLPSRVAVVFEDPRPEVALAGVTSLVGALVHFGHDLQGGREQAHADFVVEAPGSLSEDPIRDARASSAAVGAGAGALLALLGLFSRRRRPS